MFAVDEFYNAGNFACDEFSNPKNYCLRNFLCCYDLFFNVSLIVRYFTIIRNKLEKNEFANSKTQKTIDFLIFKDDGILRGWP